MNWTGGSLQRSKHANKGVLQRQKAYFAKARTQLQHEPEIPGAPFRPSWFDTSDQSMLLDGKTTFGKGRVRHIGHSARGRTASVSHEGDKRYAKKTVEKSAGSITSLHCHSGPQAGPPPKGLRRDDSEISVTDKDTERYLLQTRKRRLLEQQDWAGISASRPVNMQFPPSARSERVGKRKHTHKQRGAAFKRRNGEDEEFVMQAFMINNREDYGNDAIRVRVGTNALTDVCSTQPYNRKTSSLTTESMLFEQDAYQEESTESVISHHGIDAYTSQEQRHNHMQDEYVTNRVVKDGNSCTPSLPDNAIWRRGSSEADHRELTPRLNNRFSSASAASELSANSVHITHRLGGVQQPFRLFFDDSNGQKGDLGCRVPHRENSYEAQAARSGTILPAASQKEDVRTAGSSIGRNIVDQGPWKMSLTIPDGDTGRSNVGAYSENSVVPSPPGAIVGSEAVMGWSQHATQGGNTHPSSSSMSASLPPLKRGTATLVPARTHVVRPDCFKATDAAPLSNVDRDEELWRGFVFGSERRSSSSSEGAKEAGDTHRKSEYSEEVSTRYLPLSAAVSSVSSTSRNSMPEGDFCRRLQQQNAIASAPLQGCFTTTSPAFHSYVQGLDDADRDGVTVQPEAHVAASMTHASMQNNVSCNASSLSSDFFNEATTSRVGPDRSKTFGHISSVRASPCKSKFGQKYKHLLEGASIGSSRDLDLVD